MAYVGPLLNSAAAGAVLRAPPPLAGPLPNSLVEGAVVESPPGVLGPLPNSAVEGAVTPIWAAAGVEGACIPTEGVPDPNRGRAKKRAGVPGGARFTRGGGGLLI